MPIYYSYDEKSNLVHSFAMSDCASSEFVENIKNIAQCNDINDGYVELVDLEQVSELNIAPDELKQLKDAFNECKNNGCKRIIFYQPNPRKKDIRLIRSLKKMMHNGLHSREHLLVFARSRTQLNELISI